jgi:hypothetical protein
VPEGQNLPTAFNMPMELDSDVELDEVYSQKRRAWVEAQRNDLAQRTLGSAEPKSNVLRNADVHNARQVTLCVAAISFDAVDFAALAAS